MKKSIISLILSAGLLISAQASALISSVNFEVYKTSDTAEPVLVNSIDTTLFTSGLGGYLSKSSSSHSFSLDKKMFTNNYELESKITSLSKDRIIYSFSYSQNIVNVEDPANIKTDSFETSQNVNFKQGDTYEIKIPPYLIKIKTLPLTQSSNEEDKPVHEGTLKDIISQQ